MTVGNANTETGGLVVLDSPFVPATVKRYSTGVRDAVEVPDTLIGM